MKPSNDSKTSLIIPPSLLNDIGSRFFLNAPDNELSDPIAFCFLTELAYGFYLDECVEENDTLKFDPFALQLFKYMDIKPKKGNVKNMLHNFREFKLRVPTYGAIFFREFKLRVPIYGAIFFTLNYTLVLLVQGFLRQASWEFPKGKINVDEEPHKCAIREVEEETGYDITSKINKVDYLEATIDKQKVRLYVIPDVPKNTKFVSQTKREIKEFKWFPTHQLPTHKNDRNRPHNTQTNMFYNVMPFAKLLQSWIRNRKLESKKRKLLENKNNNSADSTVSDCSSNESRRRRKSVTTTEVNRHKKSVTQPPQAADLSKIMTTTDTSYNNTDTSYNNTDTSYNNNVGFVGTENFVNSEKFRNEAEASPKKKKIKQQKKKKKNLSETVPEVHQKHKENHKNGKNNNSSSLQPKNSKQFRSYTWQTFKMNEIAINEALNKVWGGVSL